jgi:tetratricopeptide (TPR) repeat protein
MQHVAILSTEQRSTAMPHFEAALTRRQLWGGAMAAISLVSLPTQAAVATGETLDEMVAQATHAFERAEYVESERQWRAVTTAYPAAALGWINLAVTLIINASDEMKLGQPPEGQAKKRLEEALMAVAEAERRGTTGDALLLNARGNAFGLLLRWEEARAAYADAASVAARDFVSIPRSNEALALVQLGDLSSAEKLASRLIRRDPQFRDGFALLATLRNMQGDVAGAAQAFEDLCSGRDGAQWCRRYSTVDVVLGRWTPSAVDAYRTLLKAPAIQRAIRNSEALDVSRGYQAM